MSDKINELHPSPRGVTCHVSVTTVEPHIGGVFIPTYVLLPNKGPPLPLYYAANR